MRRLRTRPTLFPYTTLFRSDLVIDEETADGREARVSRGSLCGSRGAVAGTLRYFADRFGTPRAAIEGTQLPERLVRRYARRGAASVAFDRRRRHEGLVRVRTVEYFGFLRLGLALQPEPDALDRRRPHAGLVPGRTV